MKHVISHYTREAGLRNLERNIATICRKVARYVAEGKVELTEVTPELTAKFLGPPTYLREDDRETDEIGIATG